MSFIYFKFPIVKKSEPMNFNNSLPNFPQIPQNGTPTDSQFESLLRLFSIPHTAPPMDPQNDDRNKNQNNLKAMMSQMFLNNYRNSMMPQMNPMMCPPPPPNFMNMMNGAGMLGGGDPLGGMRRNGNMMNDMMFQAFMSKFNMFNMINPYQMYPPMPMGMNNPVLNSMMMDSFIRNYLKDSATQQTEILTNNPNYNNINLDNPPINKEICICSGIKSPEEPIMICYNSSCQQKFHLSCLRYKAPEQDCPLCFLKKMDPLNQVLKVLAEPFLITTVPNILYRKKFQLDLESFKQVQENEDCYLEFRSLRLDEDYKCENSWLDYGTISLNDSIVLELNPLALNSCLKKRKDEKITIKHSLKLDQNEVKLTIKDCLHEEEAKTLRIDKKADFLIGIYLIKKISTQELISTIQEKSIKCEEECKQFLQSYFAQNNNIHSEDIYLDQMKLNLLDPIDFQLIKTPCRGRLCSHYNCFSLETFVTITKDSNPRKWRCPICRKPCYEFLIDSYLLKILLEARQTQTNIKEMILFDNGNYKIIEQEREKDDISDTERDEEVKENVSVVNKERKKESFLNEKEILQDKTLVLDEENLIENKEKNEVSLNKKRKLKEVEKEKGNQKNKKANYHLRSKKVCINK